MAHRASRRLLRDMSTPARSALRLPARSSLLAACRAASTYGREPPPAPQTPSQKMAQQALLSKLSSLSPEQISTLLNSQPGAPVPPGLGGAQDPAGSQGPGNNSAPSKDRFRLVLSGLLAVAVGYKFGAYVVDQAFGHLLPEDDIWQHAGVNPDEPASGPERAGVVSALMNDLAALHFLYPARKLYQVDPAGNIWMFPDALTNEITKNLKIADKDSSFGRVVAMPAPGNIGYQVPILDSGPPPVCVAQPVVTPAWDSLDNYTDPALRENVSNHLVAGTYNTPLTLGLVNHIVHDLNTSERHFLVSFGNHMVGWPGTVHGGALATALVESMHHEAAVVAGMDRKYRGSSLDVSYINPLTPKTPVIIRVTMQDAHSAARQRWLDSLQNLSPEARAAALTPSDQTTPDKVNGLLEAGMAEYVELVDSRKEIRFVARMCRAEDNVPICEARGTFKITPCGEATPAKGTLEGRVPDP